MKPILVIWQIEGAIQLYEFPYNDKLLKAHCAFNGSPLNTEEQNAGIRLIVPMIRAAQSFDPTPPIKAENYSFIIIAGEYVND